MTKNCGYCRHPHRLIKTNSVSGETLTYDSACECGCVESGWRYDNGPTILDAPMTPVVAK